MKYYIDKKIVIAGGGGFVGSHITEELAKYKCKISIPHTKDGWDFTLLDKCMTYLKKTKPDIVINCAAHQGGILYDKIKRGEIYYDNLLMGTYLMEASRLSGVKKYINVSAACAYPGYLDKEELGENDYWSGPIHETVLNYGFTKKAQIVQGWCYKEQYGFNSIHLIMANMYGPRERFHPDRSHGLAALIKKVYDAKRDGQPYVEVWGSGKPVREWLYVKDAARAILTAGEKYNDVSPMNIGSGMGHTITDLVKIIMDIVGYTGKIKYLTDMPDGAMKKTLRVDKMHEKLGIKADTPIKVGIKETVDWLDKNYTYAVSR